jgi:hypothetical protein
MRSRTFLKEKGEKESDVFCAGLYKKQVFIEKILPAGWRFFLELKA